MTAGSFPREPPPRGGKPSVRAAGGLGGSPLSCGPAAPCSEGHSGNSLRRARGVWLVLKRGAHLFCTDSL